MNRDDNRRKYFRFRYPVWELPRLIADGCEFPVVEMSKGGARIQFSSSATVSFETPRVVRIVFGDRTEATTKAVALRNDDWELVLRFTTPIPTKVIHGEIRRLFKEYPEVKNDWYCNLSYV